MAKKNKAATKFTVRFTVSCKTSDHLTGMIQTEDGDENEKRILLDAAGVGEMTLPEGSYTFVWGLKLTPIRRHRYSIKAERIPDEGDPVELRKRGNEQTTAGGEDVGFDDFEL